MVESAGRARVFEEYGIEMLMPVFDFKQPIAGEEGAIKSDAIRSSSVLRTFPLPLLIHMGPLRTSEGSDTSVTALCLFEFERGIFRKWTVNITSSRPPRPRRIRAFLLHL